jgi:hypothetical protein
VVLRVRWSASFVFIYWFERACICGLTVDVDGCRGYVFCRLACGGVRGGLYSVVRTYVEGLSGAIGFGLYMCGGKLLGVVVCQVGL